MIKDNTVLCVQALNHSARGAVLSCRATPQWHELIHTLQQLWNTGQALLHSQEQLTSPKAPCTWSVAPLPQAKVPPLGLEGLATAARPPSGSVSSSTGGNATGAGAKGKGAAGAKAAASNSGAVEKKGGASKGGKGAAAAAPQAEQAPTKQVLQPDKRGARPHQALR